MHALKEVCRKNIEYTYSAYCIRSCVNSVQNNCNRGCIQLLISSCIVLDQYSQLLWCGRVCDHELTGFDLFAVGAAVGWAWTGCVL